MEIKTGKQIYDFFDSSMCPDSFSKPPIEFYKEQKWIAQEELIKKLDETWDKINKCKMDKVQSNYITKTQVAVFLRDLKNAITSDSSSAKAESYNNE